MANYVEYAKTVKSIDIKQIKTVLSLVDVNAKELAASLKRITADDLVGVNDYGKQWAVTQSIIKNVSQSSNDVTTSTPFISVVTRSINVLLPVLEELGKELSRYTDKTWDGHTITARQVYIMSAIEQFDFWTDYARSVITVLVNKAGNPKYDPATKLTKNELSKLNNTGGYFAVITKTLLEGKTSIIKELTKVPDVPADEISAEILKAHGSLPNRLTQGIGIHSINPRYWYLEARKELDLISISKAQEDNEYLAMLINQAINRKNGQDDAKEDRTIEVYREKMIKNNAKVNDIIEYWKNL